MFLKGWNCDACVPVTPGPEDWWKSTSCPRAGGSAEQRSPGRVGIAAVGYGCRGQSHRPFWKAGFEIACVLALHFGP